MSSSFSVLLNTKEPKWGNRWGFQEEQTIRWKVKNIREKWRKKIMDIQPNEKKGKPRSPRQTSDRPTKLKTGSGCSSSSGGQQVVRHRGGHTRHEFRDADWFVTSTSFYSPYIESTPIWNTAVKSSISLLSFAQIWNKSEILHTFNSIQNIKTPFIYIS